MAWCPERQVVPHLFQWVGLGKGPETRLRPPFRASVRHTAESSQSSAPPLQRYSRSLPLLTFGLVPRLPQAKAAPTHPIPKPAVTPHPNRPANPRRHLDSTRFCPTVHILSSKPRPETPLGLRLAAVALPRPWTADLRPIQILGKKKSPQQHCRQLASTTRISRLIIDRLKSPVVTPAAASQTHQPQLCGPIELLSLGSQPICWAVPTATSRGCPDRAAPCLLHFNPPSPSMTARNHPIHLSNPAPMPRSIASPLP